MARPGDLVVIGAGAWGLWAAWAGLARGLAVTLIEREEAGSGASGGPVGALAPHAPERWGPESAFQMRALDGLGAALAAVEATGGERSGYGRVGCLQPLATPQRRARAEARVAEAARLWGAGRARILPADAAPGWVAPEAAPFGLLHDDLTARLDPPATCRALLAACRARDVCYLPGTE
ncbi:MAG: FAD-binding oxidoreductase, partial [Alphaproteobacteria bacterium]